MEIQELIGMAMKNDLDQYTRLFTPEKTRNWQKERDFNKIFIECQQNYANHILRVRGHLILNEAYEMLGFQQTALGAIVGWTLSTNGGNFVHFEQKEWGTLYQIHFNVEGIMFHKIEEKK